MSMKFISKIAVSVALLLSPALATDIKGKINATNTISKTPYPLEGITVDLYQNISNKWIKIDSFKTGTEGMYYFKNINEGKYTLQVDGKANYPIKIGERESQEIAPIVIHFD